MELDKLWGWQKKKLACRIRPENGNPAGDALREMFTELAGVDLNELLADMKSTKKKKEQANKVLIDHEGDKTFNEVLYRSRILGASKLALGEMEKYDEEKAASLTQKNIRKVYTLLPKSPPKRVLLEIQRERSKPLRLPDPEEQNAATAKLEKKLAKQRAARMAAIEQSTMNIDTISENSSKDMFFDGLLGVKAKTVLDPYYGDMFSSGGNYLEGMLYLSRMADSSIKTKKIKSFKEEVDTKKKDIESLEEELKNANLNAENDANKKFFNKDSNQTEVDFLAKFTCAVSLCNWSRNPANASRLASEGAVRAIIQLSLEPFDKICTFCAAAFRYMSEQPELAVSLIEDGAIAAMSELATSKTDEFILHNCAFALVNLTRMNGKEAQLVGEAAIVLALMNIVTQKSELGVICVRGLYNLTCVDATYQFIERVIRALVSLSMSAGANVKHLCAAALCNLSDLKSVRPRMVEEGAINVLTALARGAETRTRRVCAVILQNLSAAKSIRVEMASRNSVSAAYSLSSDQDPIILRCIGLTLSRLSMEPSNIQRIITESGISALCNIAVKYPTIPGISQPVASAFQLLSSHPPYRVSIVSEGSVTAIAALLLNSQDMFTLQHSLLALCNLLCEPENHIAIIQQGLIITLITMCDQDNELIKDFCSLAFLNLSCSPDSRKHIVSSGAIAAIIAVARQSSEITKRRCAATLCNISYFTAGMSRMVSDGIIPSIVSLVLAKDILTIHYSCAALCHLCCTVDNARLILESGAVDNLVQGAMEGDNVTKEFCGSVLSSLSYYTASRVQLCKLGAITALKGLADFNDDITKQRCLVAFANLSCEEVIQKQMVEEGVVSIISELANSNQEINYICCAKAICNLACCEDTKLTVAKDGGVLALLMISMVKSVDKVTKFLCVLGLNNLLNEKTLKFMLGEGLVGSIANLSKLGDNSISHMCAVIFNHLSKFEDARTKIVERVPNISSLIKLTESNESKTQIIAIRTCCNLILDGFVRSDMIKNGVYMCLERGLKCQDSQTVLQCLSTLLSVCNDQNYMEVLAKTNIPSLLIDYISKDQTSSEEFTLVVKTICMLSWSKKSRFFLQKIEFLQQFIDLINSPNLKVLTIEWIAATIDFLLRGYHNIEELLDIGILPCLVLLNESNISQDNAAKSISASLVGALRTLVTQCSFESVSLLASNASIAILTKGVQLFPDSEYLLYDIAVTMYTFATNGPTARSKISSRESMVILHATKKFSSCIDLTIVSIGTIFTDSKSRNPFLVPMSCEILAAAFSFNPKKKDLYNTVLATFLLSKISACRGMMDGEPFNFDHLLAKYINEEDLSIKSNVTRIQKNLSSDVAEAIEEGTVASLIQLSLEGKLRSKASEDFSPPMVNPIVDDDSIAVPNCQIEEITDYVIDYVWYEEIKLTEGGPAGKGPDPPEPPSQSVDGSKEYPNMAEEVDSGEVEGKTKMAFAKMQIPPNMKNSFLLTDNDFILKSDEDEEDNNNEGKDNNDNQKDIEPVVEMKSSSRPITPYGENSPNNIHRKSLPKLDKESSSPDINNRTGSKKSTKKKKDNDAASLSMSEQAAKLGLYA